MPGAAAFDPVDRLITAGGQLILTKSGNDLVLSPSSGVTGNVIISDIALSDMNQTLTVETDNTVDLGSSTKKFKSIYAHTIIGDFSGDTWSHTDDMFIDLINASTKTLTIQNSGDGACNLNISDGVLQIGGTQVISNTRAIANVTSISASGNISTSAGNITVANGKYLTLGTNGFYNLSCDGGGNLSIENVNGIQLTLGTNAIGYFGGQVTTKSNSDLIFIVSTGQNIQFGNTAAQATPTINWTRFGRTVCLDETEVTHNTDTATQKKTFKYLSNLASLYTPTKILVWSEMKVDSGTGGVDIYIDSNNRIQLETTSATYEVKYGSYNLTETEYGDGIHEVGIYLDNDGAGTVSQRTLEIILI